ncbi:MAG: radical SAM protein [bacterium]|nr:radical SAM protein [bacterium]
MTETVDGKSVVGSNIEDFAAPLFIAWQLNSACNLDCLHCCEEAGHTMPDELNHDEIIDFCHQIIDLNIPYAAISGGEPMLHPYFFDIIELLTSNRISVKVETNGMFIGEKEAKRFAMLGMRSVQVSIDGATATTHKRMREGGDWQKTIDACKLLLKHGVNTEMVFVPTTFNIHEIESAIDLAFSLGMYGFYTGKIMRIGRAAQNWELLCPTDEQYAQAFEILEEKQAQYDGKMKVYYYPYDVIEELKYRLHHPAASLLVIPNGKVKLIGPLPFLCGDLRRQNLTDVWTRYKEAWKEPEVSVFTNKVINDPLLLSKANKWIELYPE